MFRHKIILLCSITFFICCNVFSNEETQKDSKEESKSFIEVQVNEKLNTVSCDDILFSEFFANISRDFEITILVSSSLSKQTISGFYRFTSVVDLLQDISLQYDISIKKLADQKYFITHKELFYEVLDNPSLDARIKNISKSITLLSDKVIVQGTRAEVIQVTEVLKKLMNKKSQNFKIDIVSMSETVSDLFKNEWEKSIEIIDFSKFLTSFKISIDIKKESLHFDSILSQVVNVTAGKNLHFFTGEEEEREVFIKARNIDTTRDADLITEYQTYISGLTVDLKFDFAKNWILTCDIRDSRIVSELKKSSYEFSNQVVLDDEKTTMLINFKKNNNSNTILDNMPLLSKIKKISKLSFFWKGKSKTKSNESLYIFITPLKNNEISAVKNNGFKKVP